MYSSLYQVQKRARFTVHMSTNMNNNLIMRQNQIQTSASVQV